MFAGIIAIAFFIFGILIVGLILPDVSLARGSDALDCSNLSISSGQKIACLAVDAAVPYLIIAIVLVAGGLIVWKIF